MSGRLPSLGPREIVYQNPYQRVSRQVADFGDFSKEYFVTHYGTRVAVVVIRDDAVLLCRQYRLLPGRVSWEIPGGKLEESETPEAAAIRECLEETGVRCHTVQPLIDFLLSSEMIDNPTHVFHATEISEEPLRLDRREAELPVWVPLDECLRRVFARDIIDHLSVTALLAYAMRRQSGRPRMGESFS